MKGIVVEINTNDAVVLAEDGLFIKVKNENYITGQTVNIKDNSKAGRKLIAGIASIAAAFAFCTTGAFAYFTPTDYVSLDVNPSIEYSLNMFDRILDVTAVNEDGEEILESLDLKNKNIEVAVKETLDQLMSDGYLTGDPNAGVVITTANDQFEEAEQLAEELEQEVRTYLESRDGVAAMVEAEAVTPERVEEAREYGVTPGKLNLVDRLQESTTSAIDKEEWLSKPVREINKEIKENRKKDWNRKENDSWKPEKDSQNGQVDENPDDQIGRDDRDDQNGRDDRDDQNGWNDRKDRDDQNDQDDQDSRGDLDDRKDDWNKDRKNDRSQHVDDDDDDRNSDGRKRGNGNDH